MTVHRPEKCSCARRLLELKTNPSSMTHWEFCRVLPRCLIHLPRKCLSTRECNFSFCCYSFTFLFRVIPRRVRIDVESHWDSSQKKISLNDFLPLWEFATCKSEPKWLKRRAELGDEEKWFRQSRGKNSCEPRRWSTENILNSDIGLNKLFIRARSSL